MIRYAIVGELAALGAIVHTCGRSQDQLSENIRDGRRRVLKLLVQFVICPLMLKERS